MAAPRPLPTPALPWQLRLLGGFALERAAERITRLHSRSALALLARLAIEPDRDHSREVLAGWLWPTADAATARARLRQTLSTLKATLERGGPASGGSVIDGDRSVLRLVPGALECDVRAFERACQAGEAATAARWYRGELLPGHYDEWIADERLRLQALADRVLAAVPAVPATPARAEPAAGGRADGRTDGRPAEPALPRYLSSFVGGDAPVLALAGAVRAHPLLCVRGPGGVGKTRLSLAAAGRLEGDFDAIRFVPWAGCTHFAEAAERLRLALGLPDAPPAGDGDAASALAAQVARAFAGRRALLLLDNCEQLDAATLAWLAGLPARAGGLHVLMTTRRSLAVPGSHEWCPQALAVPAADDRSPAATATASMQLFADRAAASRPDFHLHEGNAAPVAAVVRALGGLPLAIELAAARVRTLPPARLAALLAEPGAARWKALGRRGAAARAEPRHASIEGVVAASLELLSPAALALLRMLCAVNAPVAGALAEAALAALPEGGISESAARDALDELVADSLLVAAFDDGFDTGWAPPEPVRDLVAETLSDAESADAHARLADALAAWAPTLAPAWPLARVDAALPLLMALLRRGVGPARVRRLLLAFAPVWPERTPPAVALDALDAALGPDDVGAEDPPALALAATLALAAGRRAAARQHAAALARALPDAPAERAGALLALARVAWRADADAAGARRHLAEAERTAAGAAGLQAAIATFDGTLANEAEHDPARAEAAYRQALRLYAAEPTAHGHARRGLRYNLAITGIYAGRAAEALAELDSLLDEAAATGDRHLLAQVHNARGSALEALGRAEEAESATRRALAEAWATLETANGLYALWNLAPMALARGDAGRAARLLGFADRFWRTHFGALAPNDALDVARTRRRCRLRLGRAAGQRAWDEGAALPLAAAVALALDA